MLDDAQRCWPDVHSRKELLLRLAATGHGEVAQGLTAQDAQARRAHQREALARLANGIDQDLLLSDRAWE
jgi:hypothetical protein